MKAVRVFAGFLAGQQSRLLIRALYFAFGMPAVDLAQGFECLLGLPVVLSITLTG